MSTASSIPAPKEPGWLTLARTFVGLREIPGLKNNLELMKVLDWADGRQDGKTLGAQNDDEAYCAKGACAIFELSKIRSPRSPAARSFETWGVKLQAPVTGAVVVFWRKSPSSGLGHVGVIAGKDKAGNLMVLSFNQDNAVTIAPFSASRVVGYRWPAGFALPPAIGWSTLPLLDSTGKPSANEA